MGNPSGAGKRITRARVFLAVLLAILYTSCTYMKMNPPPDTDKAFLPNNNSCYLATAANMLAGAGYGNGTTVQDRADDIYADLTAQFGTLNRGWTDAALSWWLGSAHNTWPNNPYTVVTVYGNKTPKFPWANANGARFIANELRACHPVGLSISWPTNAVGQVGTGGHAITGWGDRAWLPDADYSDPIASNPNNVRLTDSDRDTGGDVQQYRYDAYTNPNPGGANEGNGWYLDYDANHPYIKHIVTLEPTQAPGGGANIVRVIGSYRIHQDREWSAIDLHYEVGTDVEILSYITRVDWETENPPEIEESSPQRTELEVDWDFSDEPVPQCTWVTITTEFILRNWNAMYYDDVHFTYGEEPIGTVLPWLGWDMTSPEVPEAVRIPDVTGGYVVASFAVLDPGLPAEQAVVGQYRLLHQYSFAQSPEQHTLILRGQKGYEVSNLRIGHTYGVLDADELWAFEDWMTDLGDVRYQLSDTASEIEVNWEGQLPYPEAENITKRIPDIKRGLMTVLPKFPIQD